MALRSFNSHKVLGRLFETTFLGNFGLIVVSLGANGLRDALFWKHVNRLIHFENSCLETSLVSADFLFVCLFTSTSKHMCWGILVYGILLLWTLVYNNDRTSVSNSQVIFVPVWRFCTCGSRFSGSRSFKNHVNNWEIRKGIKPGGEIIRFLMHRWRKSVCGGVYEREFQSLNPVTPIRRTKFYSRYAASCAKTLLQIPLRGCVHTG